MSRGAGVSTTTVMGIPNSSTLIRFQIQIRIQTFLSYSNRDSVVFKLSYNCIALFCLFKAIL